MATRPKGKLIVIGGHEAKQNGHRTILEEVAREAQRRKGCLVVATVATNLPEESGREYLTIFRELGVPDVELFDVRSREDAQDPARVAKIERAALLFFTGGDQLRITSQIGDSPVYRCMEERYREGLTIAGTSAGAAAMPETMIVSGPGDESHQISALGMAPGLGLLTGVVVDSHFAERGRFGRLLGAVAQNPRNIGLGIDENTAIVVERAQAFRVLGAGAVYVVDGTEITYSSLSERTPEGVLTIHDAKLHVLGEGDEFDLSTRRPIRQAD